MIIAVSGKARSGKGEFAKIAEEKYCAKKVSFAGALKEEVMDFLNKYDVPFKPENIFGSNEFREKYFIITDKMLRSKSVPVSNLVEKFGIKAVSGNTTFDAVTYRSILQWWGTEFRRMQDENYWIKRALEKCGNSNLLYIIDDLRFINEAEALLKEKAILVRIERTNNPNEVSNPTHPSEVELDDWIVWNYIIENNSTLEEYHEGCNFVLQEILNKGE